MSGSGLDAAVREWAAARAAAISETLADVRVNDAFRTKLNRLSAAEENLARLAALPSPAPEWRMPDGWILLPAEPRDELLLQFMYVLHRNVPEADRPASLSDFSVDQWKRVQDAYRAMIRRASPCILCANGNDLPDGEWCRGCGRLGDVPSGAAQEPQP